jgi:hypothetical protein
MRSATGCWSGADLRSEHCRLEAACLNFVNLCYARHRAVVRQPCGATSKTLQLLMISYFGRQAPDTFYWCKPILVSIGSALVPHHCSCLQEVLKLREENMALQQRALLWALEREKLHDCIGQFRCSHTRQRETTYTDTAAPGSRQDMSMAPQSHVVAMYIVQVCRAVWHRRHISRTTQEAALPQASAGLQDTAVELRTAPR